jgi:alanine racemase
LNYKLDFTVSTPEEVNLISRVAESMGEIANVHLKIDTGMGRMGLHHDLALNIAKLVKSSGRMNFVSVYSHFSSADEEDKTFSYLQLERFKGVLESLERERIEVPLKHMANSAAILDIEESYFNMVRPGISLYGLYPSPHVSRSIKLKQVMTLQSKVALVKPMKKGSPISYGRRFHAGRDTAIAVIPLGYADGYSRKLTNCGEVLIHGKRFPVRGTVCMDMIMVDIYKESVKPGDRVVLYGTMGKETISISEVAARVNTIPYEVCCRVSSRVPRIYLEDGSG